MLDLSGIFGTDVDSISWDYGMVSPNSESNKDGISDYNFQKLKFAIVL